MPPPPAVITLVPLKFAKSSTGCFKSHKALNVVPIHYFDSGWTKYNRHKNEFVFINFLVNWRGNCVHLYIHIFLIGLYRWRGPFDHNTLVHFYCRFFFFFTSDNKVLIIIINITLRVFWFSSMQTEIPGCGEKYSGAFMGMFWCITLIFLYPYCRVCLYKHCVHSAEIVVGMERTLLDDRFETCLIILFLYASTHLHLFPRLGDGWGKQPRRDFSRRQRRRLPRCPLVISFIDALEIIQ